MDTCTSITRCIGVYHYWEDVGILDDELLDPKQLGLPCSLVHGAQCSSLVCVETATQVRSTRHSEGREEESKLVTSLLLHVCNTNVCTVTRYIHTNEKTASQMLHLTLKTTYIYGYLSRPLHYDSVYHRNNGRFSGHFVPLSQSHPTSHTAMFNQHDRYLRTC